MSCRPNCTEDVTLDPYYEAAFELYETYMWVLVAVGLPGNLACFLTINSMKVTSATFYVAVLAVADSASLLLKLIYRQLGVRSAFFNAACYFFQFVAFFSCFANWVLLLICFERFFTVFFIFRKAAYFTKRRIYISAAVLFGVLLLVFLPTLAFYDQVNEDRNGCLQREGLENLINVWNSSIQAILYFFLPIFLITVLTCLIIFGLFRSRQARKKMQVHTRIMMESSAGTEANTGNVERNISIMLVSAGVVFIILTIPTTIWHTNTIQIDHCGKCNLIVQIVFFLADSNHAVNFFIYFFSNARFRNRFFQLLKCYQTKCCLCGWHKTKRLSICLTPDTQNTNVGPEIGLVKIFRRQDDSTAALGGSTMDDSAVG